MNFANSTYERCAQMFEGRNHWRPFRRIKWSCTIRRSEEEDCFIFRHHYTDTVKIYRDRFVIDTGGWDSITTWSNIQLMVPLRTVRAFGSIAENRLVVWHDNCKRFFSPYYDGIEVNRFGIPLNPQPCHIRTLVKGSTDEFNALAAQVRSLFRVRATLGEWDTCDEKPACGEDLYQLMREIVARGGPGLFQEHISTEQAAPLFAERPRQVFGVERGRDYDYEVPAHRRLESNISAARRYYVQQFGEHKQVLKELFR